MRVAKIILVLGLILAGCTSASPVVQPPPKPTYRPVMKPKPVPPASKECLDVISEEPIKPSTDKAVVSGIGGILTPILVMNEKKEIRIIETNCK